ncbi:MAG: hypothetical protein ACTSR8_03970 [Promethearchaeota archaeon]
MIFDAIHEEEGHMMEWWYDIIGPSWWYFMIFGWVLYFGLGILFAYLVHKDAIKRRIINPEAWLFIILIFNFLGVLVYLLVRNNYDINEEREFLVNHYRKDN